MFVDLKALTAEILVAYVSNNTVEIANLPDVIKGVHDSLAHLRDGAPAGTEAPFRTEGKVTSKKSLADPDKITSMIDGKPYSSLKRHIGRHGYTPDSYRKAFGLKADYPMVAPGYAARRSEIAKSLGLGRKPQRAASTTAEPDAVIGSPKKARKSRPAAPKDAQAE